MGITKRTVVEYKCDRCGFTKDDMFSDGANLTINSWGTGWDGGMGAATHKSTLCYDCYTGLLDYLNKSQS